MTEIKRQCPFCQGPITAQSITTEREREAGLVYLLARCIPCNARFESGGEGEAKAVAELDSVLAKRVGTTPADWRITPGAGGRGLAAMRAKTWARDTTPKRLPRQQK